MKCRLIKHIENLGGQIGIDLYNHSFFNDIHPTITTRTINSNNYYIVDMNNETKRIRKLTPRECFRLMGVDDTDIDKIQATGISNSQLYKMAGNSIVVDVLAGIFRNMFEGEYSLSGTKKATTKVAKKSSSTPTAATFRQIDYEDCRSISQGATCGAIQNLIDEANVQNNSLSAKNAIKKFFNGDFRNERKRTLWATILHNLQKLLNLTYKGQGAYNYYKTDNGKIVDFRLDNHNCNPANFQKRGADLNISVYVALFEKPFEDCNVEYREYRCSKEDFERNPEAVKLAIINGFSEMLRTGIFTDKTNIFKEVTKKRTPLHGITPDPHDYIARYVALHNRTFDGQTKRYARRTLSDLRTELRNRTITATATIRTIQSELARLCNRHVTHQQIQIKGIEKYKKMMR